MWQRSATAVDIIKLLNANRDAQAISKTNIYFRDMAIK